MEFNQVKAGGALVGWRTDDAAQLYFYCTRSSATDNQHHHREPETLDGVRIGHTGIVLAPSVVIDVTKLDFIGAGLFGEPRGSSPVKWTGEHYKFGIYVSRERTVDPHAVIIEQNGSGIFVYLVAELESAKTWTALCDALSPELLWNVCVSFTSTYRAGLKDGNAMMEALFLAGRLRKAKGRYGRKVRVLPPKI